MRYQNHRIPQPDLNNDKLLYEKKVIVQIKQTIVNTPLSYSLKSINLVKLYEVNEGEFKGQRYYLFENLQGKHIENYTVEEFRELGSQINLDDEIDMFWEDSDMELRYIPIEYRHEDSDFINIISCFF